MSAVKKIMIALGFAKKAEHAHLTVVKHPGEDGETKVIEMPVQNYQRKEAVSGNYFRETIVIDITH